MVVASILRLAGHGEHDDFSYVTEDIRKQPFARDCLLLAERFITENKLVDAETLRAWRDQAVQKVEEAVNMAQREPVPEGAEEDWCAISTRALCDQGE